MDPFQVIASLKSDFQQIKQQRANAFREANDFFQNFEYPTEENVQLISDFDDLSDDIPDEPVKIRVMTIINKQIFDVKPTKKKKKNPPEIQPLLQIDITKPIYSTTSTQCETVSKTYTTSETQSTKKSLYVDSGTIAHTNAEAQTHSTRQRHEATNTDSILPSYEKVCFAFLENLLSDAPLLLNTSPDPEDIENILLNFVNQLLIDSKNFSFEQQLQQNDSKKFIENIHNEKKIEMKAVSIQSDVPLSTTSTQTPIELTKQTITDPSTLISIPPPKRPQNKYQRIGTCFEICPKFKHFKYYYNDGFQYPPSLRHTQSSNTKNNISTKQLQISESIFANSSNDSMQNNRKEIETETELDNQRKKQLQIELLENQNISVLPKLEEQTHVNVETPHFGDININPNKETQYKETPNKENINTIKLKPLRITALDDIESLSTFNIDSMLAELESSDDDDDDEVNSFSILNDNTEIDAETVDSGMISKVLGSSSFTVSHDDDDDLSSGEIRDSEDVIETDESNTFSFRGSSKTRK
ncbi:hypothetical protein GPJ56_001287 [Histomonas meleagridis]|uniref:uncharacterized protein n=1 Tax=Histomonas meleagridis TaxID=135588 RepID=UPI003559435D|nr:hypothetical protein GPJ56_001287 [Histomonas meleagridis]KAH0805044.1 hypothetical protein GO595_001989 [Histomonas meleagridis]